MSDLDKNSVEENIMDQFYKGSITASEAEQQLIRAAGRGGDEDNDCGEIFDFSVIHRDLMADILYDVKNSPWTDEEWSKGTVIGSWCGNQTKDQIEETKRLISAEFRAGIEAIRSYYEIEQGISEFKQGQRYISLEDTHCEPAYSVADDYDHIPMYTKSGRRELGWIDKGTRVECISVAERQAELRDLDYDVIYAYKFRGSNYPWKKI